MFTGGYRPSGGCWAFSFLSGMQLPFLTQEVRTMRPPGSVQHLLPGDTHAHALVSTLK